MKSKLALFLALSALFILSNFQFVPYARASPDVTAYYPSGYNLLGSTKYVSGSLTDLQSDNSVYMTFRSYVSASSTTANTRAFISYSDSTTSLNTPKERTWDGSAWGSQTEMATAGTPVRFVRVAYSPVEQRSFEKIVVTLSDDGYLDAYVWDGTSWAVTNNIGNVGTTANAYKCFDIAYEKTSGEALLVYSIPPATSFQIGYKTWTFSSGWSSENTYVISSAVTQTVYWASMASKPISGANEIAVGVIGDATSLDAYGLIWDGSSFSSQKLLTDTVSIATEECIAVAYEQTSGYATFVSSTGNNAFSWQWSGTAWDASATTFDLSGFSTPNWFTLKSNPINDELFAVCIDGGADLNTAYWSGSAWTLHIEHDAAIDTHAQRPADFAWEPTGSKGLLVWGTTIGQIAYKTYTAPNAWGTQQNPTMGANIHPWVQLRTNSRSVTGDMKILGAVLEGAVFDIGAIKWDGTTFTIIGTNTISSDTTVITYECFEMEFELFGPPTEFTNEAEFTGTSNTYDWTQLVWTVDSAWTTASVTITLQLYNYTLGGYLTSGNGYISYTSSGTPNTDETKSQTITTNPADFRDSAGNWKAKVKGVKLSSLQFDFKGDLIKFEAYTPAHDVAVVSVTLSTNKVYVGQKVNITVVVKNEGTSLLPESFSVTAYYACVDTAIETKPVINLPSGQSTTLTFNWDTTGVIPNANYTIKAKASVVPGETDTGDNTYVDGIVKVKPMGDVNGDGWIDGMDLTLMGFAWGARSPEWPNYNKDVDFNLDGMIDGLDLTLMGMYWRYIYTEVISHPVPWGAVTYYVVTESNSTVSNFYFNQPSKEIGFNVTGPCDTTGLVSVLIPNALLGGPYTVLVDGASVTPTLWGNATHTKLYFTYSLPPNPRKIQIFGTTVIGQLQIAKDTSALWSAMLYSTPSYMQRFVE